VTAVRTDQQATISTAQRDASARAYRHASARYASGYSPYLEQLDAQRGLLAAESASIQSQSDASTARVASFQASGGGWWNRPAGI
ncbi:hypothetical protein OY671_011745, partial [Metschnikowia pulcherrima]